MHVVVRAIHGVPPVVARVKELVGEEVTLTKDEAELEAAAPKAELLLIADALYTPSVARILRERAKALQWIQLLSAGYDAVARNGIPPGVTLTNAGDAYGPSVGTHALALLLGVQRRFPAFLASQRRGHWERGLGSGLAIPFDSTVAVIGFGHIGSAIARLLKALGAHVIGVSRHGRPHPDADEIFDASQLHAVLPRADAVVIALAASAETRHLIGARELALMKRSAVIVNIARGYIIDNVALAEALKSGVIAGAGIDVTDPEPLPEGHVLWDAPNLILTPHMSGASGAVMGKRIAKIVGDNIERRLARKPLAHVIAL